VQVDVERVAALNADEGRVSPARARRPVLAQGAHQLEILRHLREEQLETAEVREQRAKAVLGLAQRIRGDDPGGSGEACLPNALEIRVSQEPAAERRPRVATRGLVAEQPVPDEGVEVEIDHLAREVKLHRLARNSELARPVARVPRRNGHGTWFRALWARDPGRPSRGRSG